MTVTEELVDWAWDVTLEDLPAVVQRAATRHLLDGLGTAIAAVRLDAAPFAMRAADWFTAPAEATIIGDGRRVPAPAAALANGALVHALDFDDTHAGGLVHATAAVLPAAFAVGEAHGRSGADVLAAAVAGYETVTRLAAAVPHGFHAAGFHPTSVCGVFAAALVAARLAGTDRAGAVAALGVAGSQAAGSLEFLHTDATTKQIHPGLAGLAGVLAARLAGAGLSGPNTILEGDHGLYAAYTRRTPDLATITGGLGQRWETTAITIKPYPACQLSHAALDAIAELAPRLPGPSGIERVVVTVPHDSVPIVCEPVAAKRRPRTPYEGKFSLPWGVAAMLVDGVVDVDTFAPDRLARPDVLALADRVEYRAWDPGVVAADAPGRVEVVVTGGETLRHETAGGRGGPTRPLSDAEVEAKFVANCGGPSPTAEELLTRVRGLADQPDLAAVLALTGALTSQEAA